VLAAPQKDEKITDAHILAINLAKRSFQICATGLGGFADHQFQPGSVRIILPGAATGAGWGTADSIPSLPSMNSLGMRRSRGRSSRGWEADTLMELGKADGRNTQRWVTATSWKIMIRTLPITCEHCHPRLRQ
jgi:hypothetical protein